MPKRSGASHAMAALATMMIGSYLQQYLHRHVDFEVLDAAVESAALLISAQPSSPLGPNATATLLTAGVAVTLAFVWGYAFHLKVLTE